MKSLITFSLLIFLSTIIYGQSFNNLVNPSLTQGSIKFYYSGTNTGYNIAEGNIRGAETLLKFQYLDNGTPYNLMSFFNSSLIIGEPVYTTEKFYINTNSYFAGKVKIAPEFTYGNLLEIGTSGEIFNLNYAANGNITSSIANGASLFLKNGTTTSYSLSNFFKVSSGSTGAFIELPNSSSRVVIAGLGNYRQNEGFKFVVKQGSGVIEGNLIIEGNIGIGTTQPDEKLTVKGKIHAEEVKIDLSVPAPDYVFEKQYTGYSKLKNDYKLPTLKEVEDFTIKNHRLSDVPSAQEIKENGLQVGEMTAILLQKIEELTLYTIDQEKRIEALENKLSQKQ